MHFAPPPPSRAAAGPFALVLASSALADSAPSPSHGSGDIATRNLRPLPARRRSSSSHHISGELPLIASGHSLPPSSCPAALSHALLAAGHPLAPPARSGRKMEECPYCSDTGGMCDDPHPDNNKCFSLTLQCDYKYYTCVPCYARHFVLDKFFVRDMEEVTEMITYLKTKDGFNFKATIYNDVDRTYFGCPNLRGLAKAYGFEPGMIITFDINTFSQNDQDIWVDLDMIPVLPPSYFLAPRNTWNIVDDTYYTARSTLTWQEKWYLVSFVADIESLNGTYGAGQNDAPYLPLVHTLNNANICRKCMKLPRCVVPQVMDDHGEMTIICHHKTYFIGTHSDCTPTRWTARN